MASNPLKVCEKLFFPCPADPLYTQLHELAEIAVPVWMTGVTRTQAHPNDTGDPGYTMQATIIGPYRDPA